MRIDPAGYPFVGVAALVALALALFGHRLWAIVPLVFVAFFLFFFRDPDRSAILGADDVVSPADGKVMVAGEPEPGVPPPGAWRQISIFLSPLDVHVNRIPVTGEVTRVEYQPGKFLPAYHHDAARDNERNEVWIDRGGQLVVTRQVVGILARRIVCRVGRGARVSAGTAIWRDEVRIACRPVSATGIDAARQTGRSRAQRRDGTGRVAAGTAQGARVMEPNLGPRAVRMSSAPPAAAPVPEPAAAVALRRPRRGISVLPSLFTLANLFCGYACVVYAMRGEFETAAPLIGIAVVLDMLDGRIARMTGTASEFGVQFDSMADIVSFGMAPAILAFGWGLSSLGRLGWTAAFLFVAAAALRLARFNVQTGSTDKRYFIGMPSPAAAGIVAATVYAYPAGFSELHFAAPLVLLVVVPAALMVSTIRFRSFKSLDTNSRPPVPAADPVCVVHRGAGDTAPGSAGRCWPTPTWPRRFIGGLAVTASAAADCGAGRVIVTSVPCPLTLVTPMVPPLSSMLRLAIVRPSPVPVALVEK